MNKVTTLERTLFDEALLKNLWVTLEWWLKSQVCSHFFPCWKKKHHLHMEYNVCSDIFVNLFVNIKSIFWFCTARISKAFAKSTKFGRYFLNKSHQSFLVALFMKTSKKSNSLSFLVWGYIASSMKVAQKTALLLCINIFSSPRCKTRLP